MKNLNETDMDLIESRLNNRLSAAGIQAFDERLARDNDFKLAYDSYLMALKATRLASEDEVKAILRAEEAKFTQTKVVPLPNNRFQLRGWLAAASVALVGIALYWLFTKPQKTDTAALTELKTSPLIASFRDGSVEENKVVQRFINTNNITESDKFKQALSLYENQEFGKAADLFLSFNVPNDTLYLYQANALIGALQKDKALSVLDKIVPNSPVREEADWYTVLAFYKTGDLDNTKTVLNRIIGQENHLMRTKALNLLKAL